MALVCKKIKDGSIGLDDMLFKGAFGYDQSHGFRFRLESGNDLLLTELLKSVPVEKYYGVFVQDSKETMCLTIGWLYLDERENFCIGSCKWTDVDGKMRYGNSEPITHVLYGNRDKLLSIGSAELIFLNKSRDDILNKYIQSNS